jgi:ABC-type Na+ efflux pump permease subunit
MQNSTSDIDMKFRTMMIIWLVLFLSQLMFLGVLVTIRGDLFQNIRDGQLLGDNAPIVLVFALLALTNLILSFVIRARSNEQAIADQKPAYVQTGLIIACAFCESISILGFLLAVAFSYPYFYFWFALGIIGIVLHFPRRKHLLDASFTAK